MDSFTDIQLIQQGGYGHIFKATINKKLVIIKRMKETNYSYLEGFQKEVYALKTLYKLPHIAELYDVFWEGRFANLVLKYYELGDLNEYINDNGAMTIQDSHSILKQICIGLQGMHSMKIAHCDLKAENILLTMENGSIHVVLADFGCSIVCTSKYVTKSLGSPSYFAPEQLLGKKYNPFKSDVFGVGILFYELLFGRNPFFEPNYDLDEISKQTLAFDATSVDIENEFAKDLFIKLMQVNPKKRISINDALLHPFITGVLLKRKWFNFFSNKVNDTK